MSVMTYAYRSLAASFESRVGLVYSLCALVEESLLLLVEFELDDSLEIGRASCRERV